MSLRRLIRDAAVGLAALALSVPALARGLDVQWVPTPEEVVDEMLRLAEIDSDDLVYDLGSGDGRIVITAAQRYGARGVGVDLDPERIQESRANAEQAGVADRVRFIQGDLFEQDLSKATAVTLYLLDPLNRRLRPKLLEQLAPGTPVVSHAFDMGEWEPDQAVKVNGRDVYKWIVPADAAGRWNVDVQGERWVLDLEQEFQRVHGTVEIDGRQVMVQNGRLHGPWLEFTVQRPDGQQNQRFVGKIEENTIRGVADGQGADQNWVAQRAAP